MKTLKLLKGIAIILTVVFFSSCGDDPTDNLPDITGTPVVGTNQTTAFDTATVISLPSVGDEYYGQNANYIGNTPNYVDNGDGTVTDMVTGLMWQSTFDHNEDGEINVDDKLSYDDILALVSEGVSYAEHDDWRLPNIKEMYSLIMFSGSDVSIDATSSDGLSPFINNSVFGFEYGDVSGGERIIDMQCATTNLYVSSEVEQLLFGVNFADGRIKGYGLTMMNEPKKFNYLLVRGNTTYGDNNFVDNGDGTITDNASGLMWMQDDNDTCVKWTNAITYAEGFTFGGYSDWRLPDAKELQGIVDYSRSPATTNSASIDPIFNCTQITNEAGNPDYPWYWTSTTHKNMMAGVEGAWAAYVAFGRCMGNMSDPMNPTVKEWIDVHGAGAQRSDPKEGDPADYAEGHGPQGDAVRVFNYVRLVRNI